MGENSWGVYTVKREYMFYELNFEGGKNAACFYRCD